MRCRVAVSAAMLAANLATTAALSASGVPEPVSPGSYEGFARVSSTCPVFSWAGTTADAGYEVAVFRVDEPGGAASDPLLRVALPAGARAWTPPADRCLPAAGRFAWVVRVLDEERDQPWSAPRLFATGPTLVQLRSEEAREALVPLRTTAGEASGPGAPVPTATAGGAVGSSGSAVRVTRQGIAVKAANADPAGGADLVLDGSAQERVAARLSQSGIDRPSTEPQTFQLTSSGGGGMTLSVDGVAVVTTATERDTLAGLSCADGQIPRYDATETRWECGSPP